MTMKKLLILSILAVAACGSKPKTTTTPANKTGASDTNNGSMGGSGYGGGSAMAPAHPTSGDPCAN
jgi:hypothetical protein